jgi:methyl-accepting chemotaxis protein
MPVSTAFQLSLEIFDLANNSVFERQKIWDVLTPRMESIASGYLKLLAAHTPYYRELTTTKAELVKQHIFNFTEMLFTKPFDEQWVVESKRRVKEEIRLSLDMRNRCVVSQAILVELCNQLSKQSLLFGPNGWNLIELAIRVVLLDTTNAIALHYNTSVREAREQSNQLDRAIRSFGEAIGGVQHTVNSAVAALADASTALSRLANSAATEANKAATAADNTASNADQMVEATAGMMQSISEVHKKATAGAVMAHEAIANADRANATIRSLSDTVAKIGTVVGLISNIASKTNLLALNATIEAARAGQAGKGFAVVASEVKALSLQTSKATKEITGQIASIEKATLESVNEIAGTGRTIGNIAESAEVVATAVDSQAAITGEITKGAISAAGNAVTAADALKTVAETIRRAQSLAASVLESSSQLSDGTHKIDAAMNDLFQVMSTQNGVRRIADLKMNVFPIGDRSASENGDAA